MNTSIHNELSKLEVFFNGNLKSSSAVFQALKTIINFNQGYVYFLSPDRLRLQYSFNSNDTIKEISISPIEKEILFNPEKKIKSEKFDVLGKYLLVERLLIEKNVYGILIVTSNKNFSQKEKMFFKTCSMIVSNLIKDIELTQIIKMQTEALQKALVETENAYKIIKSQNKKIISADKIKTKFLSNVSHELRTPLNSIIGFSQLLQNPALGKLNVKQSEYIKDIQTAGVHLLGMINEILDISKIESGTMKLNLSTFDLSLCITETLNILKPLLDEKNIKIIKNFDNLEITADYQKIQQILFNLINNAIKFSPQNDNITICTCVKRKYFELRVKDNGCGIQKCNHKLIFKKFEQINETKNSTGLGLTITKELVKMHNGKITVLSEKNKGAEFVITLPKSTV